MSFFASLCIFLCPGPHATKPEIHRLIHLLLIQVFQTIGGALFVSAAESIFANRLLQGVSSNAPEIDPSHVLHTGASEVRDVFVGANLPGVLSSYMFGLKGAWALALALTAGAAVASFGPKRDRIKRKMKSRTAA